MASHTQLGTGWSCFSLQPQLSQDASTGGREMQDRGDDLWSCMHNVQGQAEQQCPLRCSTGVGKVLCVREVRLQACVSFRQVQVACVVDVSFSMALATVNSANTCQCDMEGWLGPTLLAEQSYGVRCVERRELLTVKAGVFTAYGRDVLQHA